MLLFEVLNHIGKVVSCLGEPLLGSRLRNATGGVCGEIGEIPAGDESAQCADPGMLGSWPRVLTASTSEEVNIS